MAPVTVFMLWIPGTGEPKWSYKSGRRITGKCSVSGDSVYCESGEGERHTLLALNKKDGQEVWSVSSDEAMFPVLRNEVLYYADRVLEHEHEGIRIKRQSTQVRSFKAATKKERLIFEVDNFVAALTVVNGVANLIDGNECYAVDLASGELKWRVDTQEATSWGWDWVVDSKLVVLYAGEMGLWAIDQQTGELRWAMKTDKFFGGVFLGERMYVALGSSVLALNPDSGEEIWKSRVGRWVEIKSVIDDVVYAWAGKTLFALDAHTGKRKWRFKLSSPVALNPFESSSLDFCSPPVNVGDHVCFSAGLSDRAIDGRLYCIDAETGQP